MARSLRQDLTDRGQYERTGHHGEIHSPGAQLQASLCGGSEIEKGKSADPGRNSDKALVSTFPSDLQEGWDRRKDLSQCD